MTLLGLLTAACGGGGGGSTSSASSPTWRTVTSNLTTMNVKTATFADGQAPGVAWANSTNSFYAGKMTAGGEPTSFAELVHNDATFYNVSALALGPGGRQMAAWVTTSEELVTREYTPAGGWDAGTSSVGKTLGALRTLAYDDAGNAFVAGANLWLGVSLKVSMKAPGGGWSTPLELAVVPGLENPYILLVAPGGQAALVWQQSYTGQEGLWARIYTPGTPGTWSDPQLLTASGTLYPAALRGCVGTDGSFFVAMVYDDFTTYTNELRVVQYRPGSGWSGPTSPVAASTSYSNLTLGALPGGKLLALWDAYAAGPSLSGAILAEGSWGATKKYLALNTLECVNPTLAVNAKGAMFLAWISRIENTSDQNVFGSVLTGDTFGPGVPLGPDQKRDALITGLGFDAAGVPTVVGFSDQWDNGALVGKTWIRQFR